MSSEGKARLQRWVVQRSSLYFRTAPRCLNLAFHSDHSKEMKSVANPWRDWKAVSVNGASGWMWGPIYLLHYSASLLLPLHPYVPPPPLLIRLSIRGRVDRLVLCDLGRAQLLEWVIVISSCLDQLGLIRAEGLWTGAGGTADYSHQRQICETIRVVVAASPN